MPPHGAPARTDSLIVSAPEDWGDLRYAAEMTARQFKALATRLHSTRVLTEVARVPRVTRPAPRTPNMAEVRQWLFNGWNTENLLTLTSELLKDEANASVLHWSFPQAYYSAFSVTLAWFKVAGYTEVTHTAVIKKFGSQTIAGDYPPALTFYASDTKKGMTFVGVAPSIDETSLSLDIRDPASVDKQIAQFLRGTRIRALDEHKSKAGIRNALGLKKRRFDEADWQIVAKQTGPTSLMSLLYRKRVQANYRDIDSLAFSGADAAAVHGDLLRVVTALNFVHETFIAAAVGWTNYEPLVDEFLKKCPLEVLKRRTRYVARLSGGQQ